MSNTLTQTIEGRGNREEQKIQTKHINNRKDNNDTFNTLAS